MPENNQYRNNHTQRPQQGQPNRTRPYPQQQRQGAGRQTPRKTKRQREKEAALSSAVKGIIAIMVTFLIVVIVIMLFWKNLFTGAETGKKETGVITSTEYIPPETKTATERADTTKASKKKTTKTEEEEEEEDENTQTIKCTGAVLLHPEPSSSSSTIDTIPAGAEVKFYRNENNWFFVEYNGKQGYAWGNYFTAPVEN